MARVYTRFVKHISGKGKEYGLLDNDYNTQQLTDWMVDGGGTVHYLPRAEYPIFKNAAVDVTSRLVETADRREWSEPGSKHWAISVLVAQGYTLRKIQLGGQSVMIVENTMAGVDTATLRCSQALTRLEEGG